MESYQRALRVVGAAWLLSYLATVSQTPLTFLLKDGLHLSATALSTYQAIAFFPAYVKPLAGVLSDAVPLCGTRRRHYLLLSATLSALLLLAMGMAPPRYGTLLSLHLAFQTFEVLISTVLGGLMVDAGLRFAATGRFSAQRVGMVRFTGLIIGPLGFWLAARFPFLWAAALGASLYLALALLGFWQVREPAIATVRRDAWRESRAQLARIGRSATLWQACGMIVLVVISPGFGTPLLYYQTDTLGFSKEFLGLLGLIGGAGGLAAALLYARFCRRFPLRQLLAASIVVHALGTLFYLGYRSHTSAIAITVLEGVAQTLALLPLYDLAARGTPRGAEALGYSVMMSVWNFTGKLSDVVGSYLRDSWGWGIFQLVWLNAGTTALVLLAVPFLPAALADQKDGAESAPSEG